MKILVLGGKGYIGRSVVNALSKYNVEVLIGSRKTADTETNIRTVKFHEVKAASDWVGILQDVDIVINTVGILRERRNESYDAVHRNAPAMLADACKNQGTRLVHVSALGLSMAAESNFIRSKYEGEQALIASGANVTIVRPSLLDGDGGYGAKWFRRISKWPVHFVMQTDGLIAPLQVSDLGEAIANLSVNSIDGLPQIVELGGNDTFTIPQYLNKLRVSYGQNPAIQLTVPKVLVRMTSHIFDIFKWTPLSFGHYELMQGYNVPAINFLSRLLGRGPMEVGVVNNVNLDLQRKNAVKLTNPLTINKLL